MESKHFPNGFSCWNETHYEIVSAIEKIMSLDEPTGLAADCHRADGHGGLYQLAEELTDEFEAAHANVIWDGNYFDEIDEFIKLKLY